MHMLNSVNYVMPRGYWEHWGSSIYNTFSLCITYITGGVQIAGKLANIISGGPNNTILIPYSNVNTVIECNVVLSEVVHTKCGQLSDYRN